MPFTNLPASRPPRERSLLAWSIAALLHVPILYLFFTARLGEFDDLLRTREAADRDDQPRELSAPPALLPTSAGGPTDARSGFQRAPSRAPLIAPIQVSPNIVRNAAAAGPGTEPARGVTTGTGSLVDRLTGPGGDPRLLTPMRSDAVGREITTASAPMAERLKIFNDSLVAAEAAARRANDWTVKRPDGTKWGMSNVDGVAAVHLGRFTLPLGRATNKANVPDLIRPPAGRCDEANARVERWAEIETQVKLVQSRDSFENRVAEIRKRKQAARGQLVTRR
jgi:hypothetical protein